IIYDRKQKRYSMKGAKQTMLTNSEIFAICKILLDSRALTKGEMNELLDKLIHCCVLEENQKLISDMVQNEKFHYIPPRHGVVFKEQMWKLSEIIKKQLCIIIDYQKITKLKSKELVQRKIKPLAIMFSEYYFYLLAYIADEQVRKEYDLRGKECWPTIYRIDRIKNMRVLDEHFSIPYAGRFEEGEFRKRVQFMYGGKLRRVKFKYKGLNIEAVLDRLPTAKILEEKGGVYLVTAEVFGDGIDMWLRSQGDAVEVMI
ncbi:MAG: WYL domain-containing protein, partial [Lachnospiraceae bacterium]|nr:WYL domain-containing protein [Lachnospiraceae bacterium]